MTLFVLGAGGQMGTAFSRATQKREVRAAFFAHADCDVRDEASLERALAQAQPGDVVVNAAARLGTLEAEREPRVQLDTNVGGAMNAALVARHRGAAIVHLSSDYVFDGAKNVPYVESDSPNPINMYGSLKLASEVLVRHTNPKHFIIRIASVFGHAVSTTRPNFVDRILSQAKAASTLEVDSVLDMSPTYALDAANVVLDLMDKNASYGIYHGTNAGSCSWYEFAQAIVAAAGVACRIEQREGVDAVRRPANSSLRSEHLPTLGIVTRPWRDALIAYLAEKEAV